MPARKKPQPATKKRKDVSPRKPQPSAQEIASAIAEFRIAELAANADDLLGDSYPLSERFPFTENDLRTACRRLHGLDDDVNVDMEAGYLLGVEVGRRIGGAR